MEYVSCESRPLVRPGHAVAHPAFVDDVGGTRRVVAQLAAQFHHERSHELRVAPAAPERRQTDQSPAPVRLHCIRRRTRTGRSKRCEVCMDGAKAPGIVVNPCAKHRRGVGAVSRGQELRVESGVQPAVIVIIEGRPAAFARYPSEPGVVPDPRPRSRVITERSATHCIPCPFRRFGGPMSLSTISLRCSVFRRTLRARSTVDQR